MRLKRPIHRLPIDYSLFHSGVTWLVLNKVSEYGILGTYNLQVSTAFFMTEGTAVKRKRKRTPAWLRDVKERGLVYGLSIILIAAATWFTFQFIEPAPPRSLTIATGSADGAYRFFAQRLKRELTNEGVDLEIIETAGSVDNLQRLSKGTVDVAFLQSGLARAQDYPQLESLGSLYYEPVWMFTRASESLERLGELEGRTIAVGGAGSGSRLVAQKLLATNGLSESEVNLSDLGGMDAVNALETGEVDALMSVASINAPMITTLLDSAAIKLASLSRAPAYALREPWLTHLVLPEGVVDLQKNIPETSVDLLAVNATLIAPKKLHPALRDLLLRAADNVFSAPTVLSAADEFPQAVGADFPLAAAADRYYEFGAPFLQRYLPFWVANLVDRLKLLALPLVALLLPLSRIMPPAYRWSVRKKIYKWYEEVQELDQAASDTNEEQSLQHCRRELIRIENDVREVQVPLGYAHELYVLRQHIDLLQTQIDRRLPEAA